MVMFHSFVYVYQRVIWRRANTLLSVVEQFHGFSLQENVPVWYGVVNATAVGIFAGKSKVFLSIQIWRVHFDRSSLRSWG